MSAPNDARRQALVHEIGCTLDEFLSGRISLSRVKTSVETVFKVPTCRVAIEDIKPYLSRVLDMLKAGEMSREEALEKLVNMEMSFDNA